MASDIEYHVIIVHLQIAVAAMGQWPVLSYKLMWIVLGLLSVAGAVSQENSSTGEMWGGHGVIMTMTAQGATLEFDCAQGTIAQPIRPDATGQFQVPGTYTPERGGPVSKANPPNAVNAIYKGSIQADSMYLEVILGDNQKEQAPQPLRLSRGKAGRLVRCR